MASKLNFKLLINGDSKGAQTALQKTTAGLGKLAKTSAVAGAAAAAAGGAIVAGLVKSGLSSVDTLAKASARLGFTTEKFAALKLQAEQTAVPMAALETGVRTLMKRVYDAGEGLSTSVRAFDKLGLTFEDLRHLSPEQQFEKVGKAISEMEDTTAQSGVALELFGRQGLAVKQIFAAGQQGLDDYQQKAKVLGLTLSQESAKGVESFNDSLDLVSKTAVGLGQHLAATVAPVLQRVTDAFYNWLESIGGIPGILNMVLRGLHTFVSWIASAGGFRLVGIVASSIKTSMVVLGEAIHWLVDMSQKLIQKFAEAWTWLVDRVRGVINFIVNGWTNFIAWFSDAGRAVQDTPFFTAWSWIGNQVGKVVNFIQHGISTLVNWIRDWDWFDLLYNVTIGPLANMIDGAVNVAIKGINQVRKLLGQEALEFRLDLSEGANSALREQFGIGAREDNKKIVDLVGNFVTATTASIKDITTDVSNTFKRGVQWGDQFENAVLTGVGDLQMFNDRIHETSDSISVNVDAFEQAADASEDMARAATKTKISFTEWSGAIAQLIGTDNAVGELFDKFKRLQQAIQTTVDGFIQAPSAISKFVSMLKTGIVDLVRAFKGGIKGLGDLFTGKSGSLESVAGVAGLALAVVPLIKKAFDGDGKDRVTVGVNATGVTHGALDINTQNALSGLVLSAQARRAGAEGEETANELLKNFLKLDEQLLSVLEALSGRTLSLAGVKLTPGAGGTTLRPSDLHNPFGSVEYDNVDNDQIQGAADKFVEAWLEAIIPQLDDKTAAAVQQVLTEGGSAEEMVAALKEHLGSAIEEVVGSIVQQFEASIQVLTELEFDGSIESIKALNDAIENTKRLAELAIEPWNAVSDAVAERTAQLTENISTFFDVIEPEKVATLQETIESLLNVDSPEELTTAVKEVFDQIESEFRIAAGQIEETYVARIEEVTSAHEATMAAIEARREEINAVQSEIDSALTLLTDGFKVVPNALIEVTQTALESFQESSAALQAYEVTGNVESVTQLTSALLDNRAAAEELVLSYMSITALLEQQSKELTDIITGFFDDTEEHSYVDFKEIFKELRQISDPNELKAKVVEVFKLIEDQFKASANQIEAIYDRRVAEVEKQHEATLKSIDERAAQEQAVTDTLESTLWSASDAAERAQAAMTRDLERAESILEANRRNIQEQYLAYIEQLNDITSDKVATGIEGILETQQSTIDIISEKLAAVGTTLEAALNAASDAAREAHEIMVRDLAEAQENLENSRRALQEQYLDYIRRLNEITGERIASGIDEILQQQQAAMDIVSARLEQAGSTLADTLAGLSELGTLNVSLSDLNYGLQRSSEQQQQASEVQSQAAQSQIYAAELMAQAALEFHFRLQEEINA